ncbi:MAG: kelch repeat-containing protein [Saprospiraceae bacterium]
MDIKVKYLFLLLIVSTFFSCIPRKCCPDVISWKRGKSSPLELKGHLVFNDDHLIYVLNASGEFERYDPDTKTWSSLPTIPHAVYSASGSILNGAIYIFSGMDYSIQVTAAVQKYDIAQNRWFELLPMKNPRTETVAVTFNDKIYLIGGHIDEKIGNVFCTSLVEEFDPIKGTWIKKADMPTPRDSHAAVAIGNKILVAGGYTQAGETANVEEYDPVQDQWTRKADMPSPLSLFDLISIQNTIYLLGGEYYNHYKESPILKYDVNADQWTQVSVLPKGKYQFGITVADDRIYLIGGHWNARSVLIGKRG